MGLVSVGALVVLWTVGGLVQKYASIKKNLGGFGILMNTISPFRWSMELQVCTTTTTTTATTAAAVCMYWNLSASISFPPNFVSLTEGNSIR